MALKPPELLNRLPTVSELLDKPPIRALADRWNRSVVAGGVRSFLDELKNDLRRRAADVQLPSIRELAKRAASFIVSQQQQSLGTAINATGKLWGAPWTGRPLPDAALARAAAVGREFTVDSNVAAAMSTRIESAICRLTGAQAAVAVHSYSGAIWLALSALAADREVLVARAEVGDLGSAEPLPKLADSANVRLREVGTTNRALATDYQTAISPATAALLTLSPDEYYIVGQTAMAELDELVALTRDREITLISALGAAPLIDPPATMRWPQRSVCAVLAGVDLAIVRGDGLAGGPACGILIGNRDIIARISQHPLFVAWHLDALRSAALLATLDCRTDDEHSAEFSPVWQLLSTPIENLRNRAERIAPQLAQAADVASAVAIETRSPISASLSAESGYASFGLALSSPDGQIAALENRLRTLPLPILGRIEGDRLVLDLRTVLPRQDRSLVDAILGNTSTEAAAAPIQPCQSN